MVHMKERRCRKDELTSVTGTCVASAPTYMGLPMTFSSLCICLYFGGRLHCCCFSRSACQAAPPRRCQAARSLLQLQHLVAAIQLTETSVLPRLVLPRRRRTGRHGGGRTLGRDVPRGSDLRSEGGGSRAG